MPGSVTLLGGEPGIGKSTLLLQLLAWWPGADAVHQRRGEPAAGAAAGRAARRRAPGPVAGRRDVARRASSTAIDRTAPRLVVVDSIQTIADQRLGVVAGLGRPGARRAPSSSSSRPSGAASPIVLVGHVTKDGALAGPRVLEHVVDTVLSFEGERHHALRLLRAVKHRFGSTDELGLFEMTGPRPRRRARPVQAVPRRPPQPASPVRSSCRRWRASGPLLVEVQALTVPIPPGVPARRNAQGLDGGRLALLLAVLERRAGVRVADQDVYASTVGGVRLDRAGHRPRRRRWPWPAPSPTSRIADELVVIGEIGLGGEVRQVAHAQRRLGEAARIGFRRAIVPAVVARRATASSWCGCAPSSDALGASAWPAWRRRGPAR